MPAFVRLLWREKRARVFFLAQTQSELGTGAGYVALLLVAYERYESPWAISLVLAADLLPSMLLGPLFGAAADRWSRRACIIVADVIRAVAFTGVALAGSIELTVVCAALAGVGTGLFRPAAVASLPSLVSEQDLPRATSLFSAIADLGFTVGPALAAAALALIDPETVIVANGVTFALSALVLMRLRFGATPARAATAAARSLFAETIYGLRATTARGSAIRGILGAATGALFCVAVFNVGELVLAREEFGASGPEFSVLVAGFGVGFVLGSLRGAAGSDQRFLRLWFAIGMAVMGVGLAGSGIAPSYWVAIPAFAVAGAGNGLMLVYERRLIQAIVPDELTGRVFGVRDALTAWAFAAGFLAGGALITPLGVRELTVAAGVAALVVAGLAWLRLGAAPASPGEQAAEPLDGSGAGVLRDVPTGQYGAHSVRRGELGLAVLEDSREGLDDDGVELGPGMRS